MEENKELDFENMTREEALKIMGLGPKAGIKAIEDRFWKMTKQYRGKDDPESLKKEEEFATLYEIATGHRDFVRQQEEERNNSAKFFGKTKKEWENWFSYTWYKILIILAAVGIIAAFLISLISNLLVDCNVVFFGLMDLDNTYVTQVLKDSGKKKPRISAMKVVVPNDEGKGAMDAYNEAFNSMVYTDPDVLISDEESYPYYFDIFGQLEPIYDGIMAELSDKAKADVEAVYMTEQDSVKYSNEVLRFNGITDMDSDPAEYSDKPILIGIRIKDQDAVKKLGVESLWNDGETTLVVGICGRSKDLEVSKDMIISIINGAYE